MKITAINDKNAPAPAGGYSQAIFVEQASRWLFVSGQIPETRDGHIPADFAAQCRLVWANIVAQLRAANLSVSDLVKVTTYLSSRAYAELNSEIRQEVLAGHCPALTVIIAEIFDPRWLLEIEVVAAAA